jgi:hypothetical protein
MALFNHSPISVAGYDIPVGAYTLFVIRSQKGWTLVISKSTDTIGRYDEEDDSPRVPMDYGQLDRLKTSSVFSLPMSPPASAACSLYPCGNGAHLERAEQVS